MVALTWTRLDGRMECVGAELRSYPATDPGDVDYRALHDSGQATPQPIRSTTWREVPVASIIETVRQEQAEVWANVEEPTETTTEIAETWNRPGPKATHDLRQVARIYQQAWKSGEPPTKTVADELVISRSAAAKLVARARAEALLPPTTRGRPQGGPNDRKSRR